MTGARHPASRCKHEPCVETCGSRPPALTRIENIPLVIDRQLHFLVVLFASERQLIMRAIVLATQKGGSGKSTLAIGLAVAAMGDGHRVAIIETDQQGTILNWGRRRTLPEPRIERAGSSLEIGPALLALRHNGFTLAVIDTPATSNDLSASAIGAADMCLIPA